MLSEALKKYKWGNILMKILIGLILLACTFGACTAINKYIGLPDDHPLEEIAEQQIKNETGFDVDLSPSSPEKN